MEVGTYKLKKNSALKRGIKNGCCNLKQVGIKQIDKQ